jgi:hypothetical protein
MGGLNPGQFANADVRSFFRYSIFQDGDALLKNTESGKREILTPAPHTSGPTNPQDGGSHAPTVTFRILVLATSS